MVNVQHSPKQSNPAPACPFARMVSAAARDRECVRPFRDRHFDTEGPAVLRISGQTYIVQKVKDQYGLTTALRVWDGEGKCLSTKSTNLASICLLFILLETDKF